MTMLNECVSVSDGVRKVIMEFMADGKEHSRIDIVKYLKENVDNAEAVTDGIITGTLKALCNSETLEVVSRGIYKLRATNNTNCSLSEKVLYIVNRTKEDLKKTLTINLLDVSENEMALSKKAASLIKMLDTEIEKF